MSEAPNSPRIVVADDDRTMRRYLSTLLRAEGYDVIAVESGPQVLELCGSEHVSLVLLDVVMRGLSGVEVCRILKSTPEPRFLPVILLTARADVESRVDGLRIGADDYICKPFDDREFLARVANMLRLKGMHDEVTRARDRLEQAAMRDELTGLFNYRYLQTRLTEEFKRAERYREPLSCAMVDIDHFKTFNDRFGHDVGDRVIQTVAARLAESVREVDVLARYGGEEFLLLLPSTQLSGALAVANRVWRAVGECVFEVSAGQRERITASMGISFYPSPAVTSRESLVKAADRALYQAKADGRNRVRVFHEAR
jgi:diguanylate cyclase (GGDEF)-like protein